MRSIRLAIFAILFISMNAFAANTNPLNLLFYCPPTYKNYTFAAAYYVTADWQTQQPDMISCDYGPKPDGSYQEYDTYAPFVPDKNSKTWQPTPGMKGCFQCIIPAYPSPSPLLCPFNEN